MKMGAAGNFAAQAHFAEQRREEMMRRLRSIPGAVVDAPDCVTIPASGKAEAEQAVRDILFRDVSIDDE